MTNGALENGEGLVIVVNRVDSLTLGALVGRASLRKVDKRCRPDFVAILHELQLLPSLSGVLLLQRHRLLRRYQCQISRSHVSCERELSRPHAVSRVGPARHGLLQTLLAGEPVEQREREHRGEGSRRFGEVERKSRIVVANRLLVRRSKSHRTTLRQL